ncbi:hypothetical protein PFISCL1PPCAC_13086, partial [Pristionchus fissidentatus]
WSFSEAQAGKAASDRIAANVKRKMRSFKDAQHNVVTAEEMFKAINSGKLLRGVSVKVAKVIEEMRSTTKIPMISELGYFEFHADYVRAWRFFGIGERIVIDLKKLNPSRKVKLLGGRLASTTVNLQDRKKIQDSHTKAPKEWEDPYFWLLPTERNPMIDQEPNDEDDEIVTGVPSRMNAAAAPKRSLFYCKDCGSSFIRYANLINHIESGKHKIKPERVKLFDKALDLFSRYVEEIKRPSLAPFSDMVMAMQSRTDEPTPEGYAIKAAKKTEEKSKTNTHLKADEAERLMKAEKTIPPKKWMTNEQIKSLIASLTSKKPRTRFTRALFDEYDENDIMEEVEPSEEDITVTDEELHEFLHPHLHEIFTDIKNP